jgi:lipoprotein-anchoring transpeptidase ErfK/SrfK
MGRLMNPLAVKVVAAVAGVLVLAGAVGIALWSNSVSSRAAATYHAKRQALDASLKSATQQGYTSADLAPVTSQERQLDVAQEPWWLPGRPGYFEGLSARTGRLQSQLTTLERQLIDQARGDTSKQSEAARAAIAQAQQANAADPDVLGLQQRLDAVARSQGAAHTVKDYRAADQQAQSVSRDASALLQQAQQENQQIQQAAQQLVGQTGGNLGAIQQAGNQAVGGANNDASVVAYMAKFGPFKGADAVARAASRLGKYAGLIGSGDVNQAAQGTAAAQRYGGQIHDALMNGLPAKSVIISFESQHLWAYEGSKVVMETPVTTGIWGVTDFGTDFGPMKVLRKSHPWTMHSPWPMGSQYWYKDTVVQWTTFFTNTGESIHDAAWEADSVLGPGSQYNLSTRSHGCVHVPYGDAEWMFNWADVGMPVIVYPGNGASVADQLGKITTDDDGTPKSAPH